MRKTTAKAKAKKPRKPGKPKAYHHGDLKPALIAAALRALQKDGAISLRHLAKELGVSHAAAYAHFPNKEAVLAAIAEEGFNMLGAELRAATGSNSLEIYRARRRIYVTFAVSHPGYFLQ